MMRSDEAATGAIAAVALLLVVGAATGVVLNHDDLRQRWLGVAEDLTDHVVRDLSRGSIRIVTATGLTDENRTRLDALRLTIQAGGVADGVLLNETIVTIRTPNAEQRYIFGGDDEHAIRVDVVRDKDQSLGHWLLNKGDLAAIQLSLVPLDDEIGRGDALQVQFLPLGASRIAADIETPIHFPGTIVDLEFRQGA